MSPLTSHDSWHGKKRQPIDELIDAHIWLGAKGYNDVKMDSPLDRYLGDILRALEARVFYSALALAVTIPDICGAIEFPNETKMGKRYRDWFSQPWCGMLHSYLGAADCWAIRCSYLHNGSGEFEGNSAAYADLSHIQFTVGKDRGVWSSTYMASSVPEAKGAVRIPVESFCHDMATSADAWRNCRSDNPSVIGALAQLLEFRVLST